MAEQLTSWQYQHSIIDAAQERGWEVIRVDVREGIVLTEPIAGGVVLRLSGPKVTSAFIRTLPEARQPEITTGEMRIAPTGTSYRGES